MTNVPDTNHTSLPPESTDTRAQQLDNQLADLTDALLNGQSINPSTVDPELSELLKMSRQLKSLIADDTGPSAMFRARLTQKLAEEWDRERFRRRANWPQIIRLSALAAALILVMGTALVLLNNPNLNGFTGSQPTSLFFGALGTIGIVAIVAVVVFFVFGLTRRK